MSSATKIENNVNVDSVEGTLVAAGFDNVPENWENFFDNITEADIRHELSKPISTFSFKRLKTFLSPLAANYLEQMAQASHQVTLQRFGRTMQMYAPIYVSNYCKNGCKYCGFNSCHKIERKRLTVDEAVEEAKRLYEIGYRDILLVSGEDPTHISTEYFCELIKRIRKFCASVTVEVYPMEEGEYRKLVEAGCDGVTLYQETYDRSLYSEFHPYGPKASYSNRLAFQENSAKAGMRRLGLGALLGLHDWRYETMAMAIHGRYLMQKYWQSRLAFSFPRMRPAAEVDRDKFKFVSDTELVQMLVSLRLCFPDAALVISTREPEYMRNNLIHLGITQISAGSKTNPGGYSEEEDSTSQFDISDSRSADEIAAYLDKHGYEPVWKDWDSSFGCV